MELKMENASCGYGRKSVLDCVNFDLHTGEAVCLLGPNGIGKTTIFKTILNFIPIISGDVRIDGNSILKQSAAQLAKHIAYVPQAKGYTYQYTVLDMLLMGRSVHISRFASPSEKDVHHVECVLKDMGIFEYRDRFYNELSGGEQQIVLIARAVVQDTNFILMDEPASNLDFCNEKRLIETVKSLLDKGKGVLMTSHSPAHAFQCCSKAILLDKTGQMKFGTVEDVVTTENLSAAYGVPVAVLMDERDNQILKTCCLY